jgi:bifunctional non-homologous end joining protein LigD
LAAYASKRDFTRSAEPPAALAPRRRTATRAFCIQKHLAHHLHYDFRLEHRGVLLSWAIPKGPSTDPAVKRLAMQVEDHPVAYGSFEGVIATGYGAGIVMVWDAGAWAPLVDDVDAALAAGHLTFVLRAHKLNGRWSLIRTRRPGRPSWLLIKADDDYAGRQDVTTAAPRSVVSDGDFPDILAQERSDPWSNGPPVSGGETGALFRTIMARARRLRSARAAR